MTETRHDELEALAAAYAIDALDREERKLFESHLADCAACREQVAAYRSVTAGLGLGIEPVEPPASLKQRTIARATGKRAPAPVQTPAAPARRSYAWLAAAAGIVLAVGMGLFAIIERAATNAFRAAANQSAQQAGDLRLDLARARGEVRQLTTAVDVLSAPDLTRIELAATPDGGNATGRAFWSPSSGTFLVRTDRLPALQQGRAYQLWIVLPNAAPTPAGVFTVNSMGSGTVVNQPTPGRRVVLRNTILTLAITNEPAAGSSGPTTPILLAGNAKTE